MNPGTKAKAAIKAAKTAMYAKSLAWKNCGERAWAEVTVSSWDFLRVRRTFNTPH